MSEQCQLRELIKIKNGKDYRNLKAGKIPVYGTGGIITYVDEYLYDGESILLPRKGSLSNICYMDSKFWTVDTMYWSIIDISKVYPKYLYCYLSLLNLSARDSGSTLPSMTFESYYSIPIKLLPIEEQKKIGDLYFSITGKIQQNNKINIELETMAKTIYDYWFMQFEFPDENGKPYKSSGGKMVWCDELKKEIPEGWTSKQINEIVDMVSGYSFSTNDYNNDGKYKLYTIKNVQDGIIVSKVDNKLKDIPLNMPNECILKPRDILMSLTGNVGRVGLVYENNVLLNQRVLKLVPKYNDISYIYLLFRDNFMRVKLEQISTGTSQKNLSPIDMGNLKIAYPDKSVLEKFTELNNIIIFKIVDNFKENQELTKLRDYLLPLLMNGQVGFKNTHSIME